MNGRILLLTALAALGAASASAFLFPPRQATAQAQVRPAAARPDEQAVRKAGEDYVEALNKGDLNGLLAFWAADGDYIDETGKHTRGRDALAALYRQVLPELKGSKASSRSHTIKFLRPEVAMEDGTLEFTAPDGTRTANRYTVVWVKTGDRWVIASARDLPAEVGDTFSLAATQLQPLQWLVGEWAAEGAKSDVRVSCRWAPNKTFLLMDYEVKREGEEPMVVHQRIGYDPVNDRVRSWVFDSAGGFGEGYWQREGNRWLVGATGVLPDGGTGGATNIYQFVDENSFVWQSVDRDVDGQPIADVEVKFVRQAAKAPQGVKP
jgi:uncharacterized protein (TIGR02246 family)